MAGGFWEGIALDLTGPGKIRLILQPTLAVLLGIRLGIADARSKDKMPFKTSLADAFLPLAVALIMDAILQHVTLGHIRLLPAIIFGTLLVWIPFVAARGLTNRAWRRVLHVMRGRPA